MARCCLFYLVIMMVGCSGAPHSSTRATSGSLSTCPDSPNCVSSQNPDGKHAVEPLRYGGTAEQAKRLLIETLLGMKRVRIVKVEEQYLHAEFTSALFRFVDDVEFLLDDEEKTIHVRSASRIGYSDFGANRKRVEEIRSRFETLTHPHP
jgi:uncharacterized protein (DUF1499 family)